MLIFFIIFFNIFFSFQSIPAAFFCDNYLREVEVLDKSTQSYKQVAYGWNQNWDTAYIFNIDANPGDLIRFRCLNVGGPTLGAGCFLVDNNCYCYNFDNDVKRYSSSVQPFTGIADLAGKRCSLTVKFLDVNTDGVYYYYTHLIPIDANLLSCKNNDITIPYGVEYPLDLSNSISANFNLKNLEISIKENYDYFTLNGNKINEATKFSISSQLIFYSIESKRITIKFESYGIFFTNMFLIAAAIILSTKPLLIIDLISFRNLFILILRFKISLKSFDFSCKFTNSIF